MCLFIFFINQLAVDCQNDDSRGIFVNDLVEVIKLLLFADDIVLMSEREDGLQTMLDTLPYCVKSGES